MHIPHMPEDKTRIFF